MRVKVGNIEMVFLPHGGTIAYIPITKKELEFVKDAERKSIFGKIPYEFNKWLRRKLARVRRRFPERFEDLMEASFWVRESVDKKGRRKYTLVIDTGD